MALEDVDRNGEALHSAVKDFKTDTVKALIEAGVSVEHRDGDKNTPLMTAAMNGYDRILLVLLEAGAQVNCVNENGASALMLAMQHRYSDYLFPHKIVKLLLKWGANINHVDIKKESVLHYVVRRVYNDNVIMKELLLLGADVRVKDKSGQNALETAMEIVLDVADFGKQLEVSIYYQTLLYAAGATYRKEICDNSFNLKDEYKMIFPQFIQDDLKPSYALKDLCRKQIREHILSSDPAKHPWLLWVPFPRRLADFLKKKVGVKQLSPAGANNPNLFVAVPQLPLPRKLKEFLLFNVDITQKPPAGPSPPRTRKEQALRDGINWWDPDMGL